MKSALVCRNSFFQSYNHLIDAILLALKAK